MLPRPPRPPRAAFAALILAAAAVGVSGVAPDVVSGFSRTHASSAPDFQQQEVSSFAAPADLTDPPADAVKSPSGLVSKLLEPGTTTERAQATDLVTVHYTGWSSTGEMFDSSVARGVPSTFPLDRVMPGWGECLELMVIGETRRCWVPQDLAYAGAAGRPTGTVVFDIQLLDRRHSPAIPPPDVKEPPAEALRTSSGLASLVLRPGTGVRQPGARQQVTVHYTGWTTDGKMFESTVAMGKPATFYLDDVIRGWTEGLQMMVVGERRRFWIPENLAYQGRAGGPRGMLVFDIELLSLQ